MFALLVDRTMAVIEWLGVHVVFAVIMVFGL